MPLDAELEKHSVMVVPDITQLEDVLTEHNSSVLWLLIDK
jgi:hypothetical protein